MRANRKKVSVNKPKLGARIKKAVVVTATVGTLTGAVVTPRVMQARRIKSVERSVLTKTGVMDAKGKMSLQNKRLIDTYKKKYNWSKMTTQEQTNNFARLAEMTTGVNKLKQGLSKKGVALETKNLVNSLRRNRQNFSKETLLFNERFIWGNATHGNASQKRLAELAKEFNSLPKKTRGALTEVIISKPIQPNELSRLK